jgi:O-antigen/teichoic acid export membrane protein
MHKKFLYLSRFASVGLSRVLANSVTVIYSVIFLRFGGVSVQTFGEAIFVMYVLGIISTLATLGMTEGIQKYVNKVDPRKVIGPAVIIEIAVMTVVSILILILDKDTNFTKGHTLLYILALFASIFNLLVLVFNGLHQQWRSSLYQILFVILLLSIASVTFFKFHQSLLVSLLLGVIGSWGSLSLFILFDLYKQDLLDFRSRVDKRFLQFSLNTFIYILCFQIITQTDVVFINFFLGDQQTGIYKSVTQSALLSRILGLTISTPLLPIFSKLIHQEKIDVAFAILRRGLITLWIFIIGLFLGSLVLGKWFLDLLFAQPEITSQGIRFMPLLIFSFGIQTLNTPTIMYFQALGREKLVRNLSLLQAVLYVIGMALFTRYGLFYPALTLLVTESISIPYYYYHIFKSRPIRMVPKPTSI